MNTAEISRRFDALLEEPDPAIRLEGSSELLEAIKMIPTPKKAREQLAKRKLESFLELLVKHSKWSVKSQETDDPVFAAAEFSVGKDLATLIIQIIDEHSTGDETQKAVWQTVCTLAEQGLPLFDKNRRLEEEISNRKEEIVCVQQEIDDIKDKIRRLKDPE